MSKTDTARLGYGADEYKKQRLWMLVTDTADGTHTYLHTGEEEAKEHLARMEQDAEVAMDTLYLESVELPGVFVRESQALGLSDALGVIEEGLARFGERSEEDLRAYRSALRSVMRALRGFPHA